MVAAGPFTASAGTHTLTLAGLDPPGGDNTTFLDDVRLGAAPAAPSYWYTGDGLRAWKQVNGGATAYFRLRWGRAGLPDGGPMPRHPEAPHGDPRDTPTRGTHAFVSRDEAALEAPRPAPAPAPRPPARPRPALGLPRRHRAPRPAAGLPAGQGGGGGADPYVFILGGEADAQHLLTALDRVGVAPAEDAAVLDFGCGVGRILAPLHRRLPQARLFGTDVEADLIRWCRRGLAGVAQFHVNGATPPLPYRDGQFDLIYSWSVFTHLDEPLQFRWLEELRRVARPGATLILTVHGPGLSPEHESHRRGFSFVRDAAWGDYFPDFYHTAFHTPAYVRQEWARFFTVLDYWERGQAGGLDVVTLRRD